MGSIPTRSRQEILMYQILMTFEIFKETLPNVPLELKKTVNFIRIIKRKVYEFLDEQYFSLKIIQAFSN
jgi:hypothetical protein